MQSGELIDEVEETKVYTLDGNPKIDSFFNRDGLLLKTYAWIVKNAIGIVLLIHGISVHTRLAFLKHNVEIVNSDRAILLDRDNFYVYKDSWVEEFNKNGYSVYGIDLQSHGLSEGVENLRCHIDNFDTLVDDVICYLNRIHKKINEGEEEEGEEGEEEDDDDESIWGNETDNDIFFDTLEEIKDDDKFFDCFESINDLKKHEENNKNFDTLNDDLACDSIPPQLIEPLNEFFNGVVDGLNEIIEEETNKKINEGADKEADEGVDKEADEGADKEADEGADKEADEGADKEADEGADKEADEGVDKEADEEADEEVDKEADEGVDKEADEGVDKEADEGVDKEADEGVDKEADEGVDKEADEGVDKGVDKVADEESDETNKEKNKDTSNKGINDILKETSGNNTTKEIVDEIIKKLGKITVTDENSEHNSAINELTNKDISDIISEKSCLINSEPNTETTSEKDDVNRDVISIDSYDVTGVALTDTTLEINTENGTKKKKKKKGYRFFNKKNKTHSETTTENDEKSENNDKLRKKSKENIDVNEVSVENNKESSNKGTNDISKEIYNDITKDNVSEPVKEIVNTEVGNENSEHNGATRELTNKDISDIISEKSCLINSEPNTETTSEKDDVNRDVISINSYYVTGKESTDITLEINTESSKKKKKKKKGYRFFNKKNKTHSETTTENNETDNEKSVMNEDSIKSNESFNTDEESIKINNKNEKKKKKSKKKHIKSYKKNELSNETNDDKIFEIHKTSKVNDAKCKKSSNKKSLPIYIIGSSMGANIAMRTLQILKKSDNQHKKLNIKGCIALSSMIHIHNLPPTTSFTFKYILLVISNLLAALFPKVRIQQKVGSSKYKYNNYVWDIRRFDKMICNQQFTYKTGHELLRAMYNLYNDMEYMPRNVPILFVHSKDDILCAYDGVVTFFNLLRIKNKELFTVEKRDHLLVWEPESEVIVNKILNWLSDVSLIIDDDTDDTNDYDNFLD
ncbi:Putative lysophospholipase/Alpha/beta hydrolase family, putative [Hepatocystis sp. ex Piliocolobus tephrosceles]|nr:Putative lysophospholipase/Alpha/beta hydrolase family, putative [Hepatocystis sp. ex Piliocolobus tephrosceles]